MNITRSISIDSYFSMTVTERYSTVLAYRRPHKGGLLNEIRNCFSLDRQGRGLC